MYQFKIYIEINLCRDIFYINNLKTYPKKSKRSKKKKTLRLPELRFYHFFLFISENKQCLL